MVRVIKKQLVKRSLDMIKDIAARPEKDGKNDYGTFWDSFGKFIKLGAIEDQSSTCALLPVGCHAPAQATWSLAVLSWTCNDARSPQRVLLGCRTCKLYLDVLSKPSERPGEFVDHSTYVSHSDSGPCC